jgi:hypothetical protein
MTLEQIVKTEIKEILEEKVTVSASWIKANVRKLGFNFEEFCQVFPNVETLTLENGEIIVTLKAEMPAVKMVKVTGNTYEVKCALKQFGFKWDAEKKAWFGTEEQKQSLQNFVNGLKDEYLKEQNKQLKDLSFEIVK